MNWDDWHANSATLARKLGLFELALFYEECRRSGWRPNLGNRDAIFREMHLIGWLGHPIAPCDRCCEAAAK